jgi:hypothetical protein
MLTPTDFLHLPYPIDLTESGIAYACHSLACTYDRMGDSPFGKLRHIVSNVAVELAFRRYLGDKAVPFHVLGKTPFTRPVRYDISLGGHRCIVKSFLINRHSQIAQLQREPGSLLQVPALIPVDEFSAENHKPDDMYLFAFLLGGIAATRVDVDNAIVAGKPIYLVHPLPEAWARPRIWVPVEKLSLKSECESPIMIEIGGQDAGRDFLTVNLELPPRQRKLVEKDFHSLAYIYAKSKPEARIGIHSPLHGEPYLISPHEWGNLWIYGMDIFLTGWLSHEQFRRKARVLNAGARTFQFDRTRVKNLLVPISDLNPLGILLEKVRRWEAERSQPNPSS